MVRDKGLLHSCELVTAFCSSLGEYKAVTKLIKSKVEMVIPTNSRGTLNKASLTEREDNERVRARTRSWPQVGNGDRAQ